jgi:hypothetical protein
MTIATVSEGVVQACEPPLASPIGSDLEPLPAFYTGAYDAVGAWAYGYTEYGATQTPRST